MRFKYGIVLLASILFLTLGCQSRSTSPTPAPDQANLSSESSTDSGIDSSDTDPSSSTDSTSQDSDTDTSIDNESPETDSPDAASSVEEVVLTLSYAALNELGANEKEVSITATIDNNRSQELTISDGGLAFVDDAYGIHMAIPDSEDESYLVGATLGERESITGIVDFVFPSDVSSGRLVLCPDEPYPCVNQIQIRIDAFANE